MFSLRGLKTGPKHIDENILYIINRIYSALFIHPNVFRPVDRLIHQAIQWATTGEAMHLAAPHRGYYFFDLSEKSGKLF
jgi:hypothetical protein